MQELVEYLRKLRSRPSLLMISAKSVQKWLVKRAALRPYRAVRKYILAYVRFQPPTVKPATQKKDLPDYIIWGVIDWHFRHQRPQQLAKALAETRRRVFYVSSNFRDDERAGFDVEPLDTSGRLFQIKLFAKSAPIIYFASPSNEIVNQLRASIGQMLCWADTFQIVSFVQHPFWQDIAKVLPNSQLVYDCIDHHEGFGNNSDDVLSLEYKLLRDADLTVTTSAGLDQFVSKHSQRRTLIRNACDFEHFVHQPEKTYSDPECRHIIGYYGAIANWLDLDLMEAIASRFADCCILLVGADTVGAQLRLAHLPNVVFIGEVAYVDLPYYLHSFEVALLPFKVVPLTLSTNPVKVYEYLSAGKPVVSVNLPEMSEFGDLVRVADSRDGFLKAIAEDLNCKDTQAEIFRRHEFAKKHTWRHRVEALIASAEDASNEPIISVVVVTYNNLDFTRACLLSLDEHSHYASLEIIVVDNASCDGTKEFLREWVNSAPKRKLILNEKNKGFAAANNQGLAVATGDYLVLLNNDTFVTPGWVRTLYRHLKQDKTIGLIGPVTNNIGNEAKIELKYSNMEEMLMISASYTRKNVGQLLDLRTVAFFCVMFRREIYERVGPLDESFGLGFFEDDDYCRRVEQAGLRIVCAQNVFIHHHLSASFLKLERIARQKLFSDNKQIYEAKWGEWIPHNSRKYSKVTRKH